MFISNDPARYETAILKHVAEIKHTMRELYARKHQDTVSDGGEKVRENQVGEMHKVGANPENFRI